MRSCFFLLLILAAISSSAQNTKTPALQVGDAVPNLSIKYLANPLPAKMLHDQKGKLLILDFWATWCMPCLQSMPKLQHLQDTYGDQLQILTVAYQSVKEIDPFLKHLRKDYGFNLPVIFMDTQLLELFPHIYLPHYVWIGTDGTVKGITGMEEVTEENVKTALQKAVLPSAPKTDEGKALDPAKPAFSVTPNSEVLFQSVLTGFNPSYLEISTRQPLADTTRFRITVLNNTIPSLFRWAYATTGELGSHNRLLILSKDSLRFRFPKERERVPAWFQLNTYCYELIGPAALAARSYEFMQRDLDRMFPQYKAGIEKRTMKCLALVRDSSVAAPLSFITSPGKKKYAHSPYGIRVEKGTLTGLTILLASFYLQGQEMPVVDATGIREPVTLSIEANLTSIPDINKALHAYGLLLTERELSIDMIVVRDRDLK